MTSAASCVFVYGTLMSEEVLRTLLGRLPKQLPALIQNHRRYAIRGRQYPAVIPAAGHTVKGKVMFDLTSREMRILDEFEDMEYTREEVTALPDREPVEWMNHQIPEAFATMTSGEEPSSWLPCQASVYVWGDREGKELQGEWDYNVWRGKHLLSYVDMCKGFPEEGDGLDLRMELENK